MIPHATGLGQSFAVQPRETAASFYHHTGIRRLLYADLHLSHHNRPYQRENTVSRPICEVKHVRAESVLGWGTTWEASVLFAFLPPLLASGCPLPIHLAHCRVRTHLCAVRRPGCRLQPTAQKHMHAVPCYRAPQHHLARPFASCFFAWSQPTAQKHIMVWIQKPRNKSSLRFSSLADNRP